MKFESGANLRDGVVASEEPLPANDEKAQPTAATDAQSALPALHFFNRALNTPQQEAVRGIYAGLHHPFPYLLFGPPGTGQRIPHSAPHRPWHPKLAYISPLFRCALQAKRPCWWRPSLSC